MRRCAFAFAALLALLPAAGRAQQDARATLTGVVRDAATGELLAGVLVRIEGSDLQALTDSAGRYRLPRVPAGVQVLRAERLGYAPARITLTVPLQGVLARDIVMAASALHVEGVVVTADAVSRARGELATASVIAREAIAAQTAASLAGVLELVPGVPLSPPGLDGVQQIGLRAVPTSTGSAAGPSASDLASFGTLVLLDGVPLSNNANLQSTGPRGELRVSSTAGGGIDLRRIPAATIERVEVIRGLPSARYGDLTQGVIVVDTRAGEVEPAFSFRHDARTIEASAVGGRGLGSAHIATANLDVARTRLSPGLTDDQSYRVAAQLSHRAFVGGDAASARLVLDTRVDAYEVRENSPERPEIRPGYETWTRERGVRISERARLALGGASRLELTASIDKTRQRAFVQSFRLRPALPFTDRLTEGRQIGRFVTGPYISEVNLEGDPWLLYGRLEADLPATWLGFEHRLRTGVEMRREWNAGPGYRFDIATPPQVSFNGVRGFDRPRRYDLIPPVATSALYLDDALTRTVAGDMLLSIQAGLRLDVLHQGTTWFSGARDAVLQPRLNVQLSPLPWLRLRGAAGQTAKAPDIGSLYPAPEYYDVVNVNWFTPDPAERLAVLTTFIRDPTNPDLGFSTANKAEAGIEVSLGGRSAVALVAFDERIRGGHGIRQAPGWLPREHYQLSDSTIGTGRPPTILEPASSVDTVPLLLSQPANNQRLDSRGLELTATLPEVRPLRTQVELQGAWVETRFARDDIEFNASQFSSFQENALEIRIPYWQGTVRVAERAILTSRVIHRQPELGLVITGTVQHVLRQARRDIAGTDTLAFAGYLTRDGRLVPVPPEERTLPEYADLRRTRLGVQTQPRPPAADWFLSLQVSKTLPLDGRLSFYAFNALDRQGQPERAGVAPLTFPAMRFGLEIIMPARGLARLIP